MVFDVEVNRKIFTYYAVSCIYGSFYIKFMKKQLKWSSSNTLVQKCPSFVVDFQKQGLILAKKCSKWGGEWAQQMVEVHMWATVFAANYIYTH